MCQRMKVSELGSCTVLVQESCVARSSFLRLCLTGGTDLLFDPLVLEAGRILGRNWGDVQLLVALVWFAFGLDV